MWISMSSPQERRRTEAHLLSSQDAYILTDEDAEKALPDYDVVRACYRIRRREGDAPEVALRTTLSLWRELWHSGAFVPHRRSHEP